jgi:hypothetical protein
LSAHDGAPPGPRFDPVGVLRQAGDALELEHRRAVKPQVGTELEVAANDAVVGTRRLNHDLSTSLRTGEHDDADAYTSRPDPAAKEEQ